MIDIPFFRKILTGIKPGYITPEDYISKELQDLFIDKKIKFAEVKWLFVSQSTRKYKRYKVACFCDRYNKEFDDYLRKTDILRRMKYLKGNHSNPYNIYCHDCEMKIKQEKQQNLVSVENALSHYIENFLNPDKTWAKDIKYLTPFYSITNPFYGHVDDGIAEYIKALPYAVFLKTPYWEAIARRVRSNAKFKCQICSSKETLNIHHNTYARHGYEHIYWKEDLICTCNKCHSKHHGKESV